MAPEYVIWSFEHRAWWAADRIGYTRELAQAGRYTPHEAEQIVTEAAPGYEECMPEDDAQHWFDTEHPLADHD